MAEQELSMASQEDIILQQQIDKLRERKIQFKTQLQGRLRRPFRFDSTERVLAARGEGPYQQLYR